MSAAVTRHRPSIAVFDVGNVLIAWDPRHLYRRIFSDPERMEWFLANVCTPDWNLEMDRGRSFADGVALLVAEHPEWAREIRAFDERWPDMVHGEISGNVRVLEAIRAAGRPNYAITNFSREKFALARARFPFLARFDGTVVSAEERLLKPDPAIYRVLLDRYGLAAADCVFIDDSAANVAAARGLGMQAVHATPRLDLAAALAATGYELPSATVATGPTP